MRLAGKVALVTGAQQGIGRALALAMAGEGADVGLNFLDDPGAAERVAGEIRGRRRKVLTVKGDVAQARDVQALVAAVTGGLGPSEILGSITASCFGKDHLALGIANARMFLRQVI